MNRFRNAACCLAVVLAISIAAQAAHSASQDETLSSRQTLTASSSTVELNTMYFKGYVTDFADIVTAPGRWDGMDWITAAAVSAVAAGLYDNDAKIQKWVLEHKTADTDKIGDRVTDFGHGKYTPVIVGGMYVYGSLADDGKMKTTSLLSVESFALTGVFVQVLKHGTGRHRPYTNDPPSTWDGPVLHDGSHMSFPSGHASSAFAVATVIATEYDNFVVPALAYSIAGVTALNRVSHNAHWSSDVFVGSAIGYFTGKAVAASHRTGAGNRLSFAPMIDGDTTGARLTWIF